jgi:hypothetical protein
MIAQENKSSLKQSQQFQSVSFGIKREGLAHIFNVLRNQLYSDKVLAVVREYSANGLDAQVESGKQDRPIVVTLPNPLNLAFKVRDFGLGLSEQQVHDIYANYGESTKRGTNEQIGQLGLGSKSAFAYGENFLIRSFQNGVVTLYNAFIDPSQVGQIAKLHSESTDEEDGIEIEIPVNQQDINVFKEKAQGLFKYFKIQPIVRGNKEFSIKPNKVSFQGSCFAFIESDDSSSAFVKSSYGAVAVMGNIAYPIDPRSVNWGEDVELVNIFKRNVVIDFKIGDLEVSASREALQYTPHTQKNIIAKAKLIKDECLKDIHDKISTGKSMYEAKCLYNKIFDYYSENSLSFLAGIIKKDDLKFNGKDLTSGVWTTRNVKGEDYAKIVRYELRQSRRYNSKDKVRGERYEAMAANEDYAYVIKDMKSTILNRIAPLCEMENNHLGRKFKKVYLIEPGPEYDQWAKDNQFDAPTIKLSDLPKVSFKDLGYVKPSASNGSSSNAKHSKSVFKPNFAITYTTARSDFFTECEVDIEDGGIWFEIDRFVPVGQEKEYDPTRQFIRNLKEYCEFLGLDHQNVIAVKTKEADQFKNSDKWQTVAQWIGKALNKYVVDNNFQQKYADRKEFVETEQVKHGEYFNLIVSLRDRFVHRNKEMATLAECAYKMQNEDFDAISKKVNNISLWAKVTINTVKPSHDLKAQFEAVRAKYPMYMNMDSCVVGWRINNIIKNIIVDYVNMVDSVVE